MISATAGTYWLTQSVAVAVTGAVVAVILGCGLKVVNAYDRGVVFRFGRFVRVLEPGLGFVIPIVESLVAAVDMRVRTTRIVAEHTLTKDAIQVNVSAVVFWRVVDSQAALLAVADYANTLDLAAQTGLRELIGKSILSELLSNRAALDLELLHELRPRTAEWGVELSAVEIRDVEIPDSLQNAMSQEAQAARERAARLILALAEKDAAQTFLDAAALYEKAPIALELRRMNILYEGLKTDNTSIVVIPSSIPSSMSTITGLAALAAGEGR
ncbi:MAG TPA: SPFH domain-containing protein [Candidatus Acidoferrales bacterium]|nr:SPFH domain-containing protein [Candidatus Acidoferrales bacterium]